MLEHSSTLGILLALEKHPRRRGPSLVVRFRVQNSGFFAAQLFHVKPPVELATTLIDPHSAAPSAIADGLAGILGV